MTAARNPHNLVVGQKLYFSSSGGLNGVEIIKIGRKRAYLKDCWGWVDLEKMETAGSSRGPFQVYRDQEDFDLRTAARKAKIAREAAWSAVRREVGRQYTAPVSVTADNIRAAAALLGIELPEDGK